MLKSNKGITLVALVITIVVMLILAGISISLVMGDNGIFTKAKSSKTAQINGQALENDLMTNADGAVNDVWANYIDVHN